MNHKTKKNIYNVVVITLIVAGLVWVSSKFFHLGNVEYTNNAQVKQLIVPVNSRAQGYVKEVRFNENQLVKKGDTLVIIEDVEYRYRLALAESDYQNALAGKNTVASSVQTVTNNTAVTESGIQEVQTLLNHAETEYKRYSKLLQKESVTQQEYDGVKTKYLALKAKYETLKHQKQSTVLATSEVNSRLAQNDAIIALAKTAVDLAKLNLSYTVILAATDGYTGRKNIQVGQLIQPGQPIVDIVDSKEKWIIANYKESQTANISVGQIVDIKVDALPGVVLKGTIESMSQATGASFSVIPQDNTSGNFVKVEQRIPVRIAISKDNQATDLEKLKAGMNVEATVNY